MISTIFLAGIPVVNREVSSTYFSQDASSMSIDDVAQAASASLPPPPPAPSGNQMIYFILEVKRNKNNKDKMNNVGLQETELKQFFTLL